MNESIGVVREVPVTIWNSYPAAWESDTGRSDEAADAAVMDASVVVRALLRMSGLTPDPGETEALVAGFVTARAAVRALYHVPEARYVEPGLVFSAAP